MSPTVAVQPPVPRPPLRRPRHGRMVGGVAAGVAAHLGLEPKAVRIAFVVTTLASGLGLVLYVWLWALAPEGEEPGRELRTRDLVVGALLLLGGLATAGARVGLPVSLRLVLPLLAAVAGIAIVYTQLDEVQRATWARRAGGRGRVVVAQIAAGSVLVLVGVLFVVQRNADPASVVQVLLAVLAVLAGLTLTLAPWGLRLWRDLDGERAARVRESERVAIAAHLHDSVLQTLALVQRASADPQQVQRLVRAQERDLRDWLYGSATAGGLTQGPRNRDGETVEGLGVAVRRAVAEVEDDYGVPVEVVLVGDTAMTEPLSGLVAALREAVLNAVRHAGAPVSVFVEVAPGQVEAFVRDRGPGFDLAAVPTDRLGVRASVIGRMARLHGSATVRSSSGEGTEVALLLPLGDSESLRP